MDYSFLYQRIVNTYSTIPMHLFHGYTLSPLQVFLEVTYTCNLSCDFCQFLQSSNHANSSIGPQSTELSIAEFKSIVRDIPRTAVISFTGGEPFVKSGFMDLLAYSSELKKTHIFTNGTRINAQIADSLVDLGARNMLTPGLILVGISLEGLEDTHNQITRRSWAFERTIRGLEALGRQKAAQNKKFPLVELKTVISEKNVRELYEVYLLAKKYKANIFNVMTMNMLPQASRIATCAAVSYLEPPPPVKPVDLELLKDQLTKIYRDASKAHIQIRTTPQGFDFEAIINHYKDGRTLEDYRCFYPWYGAGISAYGDVLICPYIITGNVKRNSLRELLNNTRARNFRNHLQTKQIFPGCWGCCMLVPRHGWTRMDCDKIDCGGSN